MAKQRKTELDIDPSISEEVKEAPPPSPTPVEGEKPAPSEHKILTRNQIAAMIGGVAILLLVIIISPFVKQGFTIPEKLEIHETKEEKPPASDADEMEMLINISLESFTLPFREGGDEHFWRVGVALQLDNPDALEEIEQNLAIFREAVYIFLKTHERQDFQNPAKREKTLFDLRILLDRSLQNGRVEKILITEFNVL